MNTNDCATIRTMIPDDVGGRLDADERANLGRHADACAECGAERDLARLLLASRSHAPAGLAERVSRVVRLDREAVRRPWWGLSAAAVAALALGVGVASKPTSADSAPDVPGYAYELEEGAIWSSDDGLLAGAPPLDLLSDEALQQLLDELTVGGPGGAA
jgi:anti-sigma factor RsiW